MFIFCTDSNKISTFFLNYKLILFISSYRKSMKVYDGCPRLLKNVLLPIELAKLKKNDCMVSLL